MNPRRNFLCEKKRTQAWKCEKKNSDERVDDTRFGGKCGRKNSDEQVKDNEKVLLAKHSLLES